jgi:uncharacterized DUF497 family protein
MNIEGIIWLRAVVDKLAFKHHVEPDEVEQVFNNKPKIRFIEKGERKGEDVYMALGRTDAGRYLAVLFIYKKTKARVGWVEAIAETHHNPRRRMMGFALLYPSYSPRRMKTVRRITAFGLSALQADQPEGTVRFPGSSEE